MTTYSEGDEVWGRDDVGRDWPGVIRYLTAAQSREPVWRVRDERTGKSRSIAESRLRPRNPDPITTTGVVTRPFSHSRAEGREVPKETVWRSKAYLAHARETGRQWGCPGCGSTEQIEAAHDGSDGGMGLKASDVYATGQCNRCHRHRHDTGTFPGMTVAETRDAIRRAQVQTMSAWIRKEK